MAGFLRKLKVGKGWKQRYVTVKSGVSTLEYRKQKTGPLSGSIDLSTARVLDTVPRGLLDPALLRSKRKDVPDPRYCFRVVLPVSASSTSTPEWWDQKKNVAKEFVFAAPDLAERQKWLAVLCAKDSTRGGSRRHIQQPHPTVSMALSSRPRPTRRLTGRKIVKSKSVSSCGQCSGPSSAGDRRVEVYGRLVCFRVQRMLIEWIRCDEDAADAAADSAVPTAILEPPPAYPVLATPLLMQIASERRTQREMRLAAERTAAVARGAASADDAAIAAVRSVIHDVSTATSPPLRKSLA